jgi:hypothetical protein
VTLAILIEGAGGGEGFNATYVLIDSLNKAVETKTGPMIKVGFTEIFANDEGNQLFYYDGSAHFQPLNGSHLSLGETYIYNDSDMNIRKIDYQYDDRSRNPKFKISVFRIAPDNIKANDQGYVKVREILLDHPLANSWTYRDYFKPI